MERAGGRGWSTGCSTAVLHSNGYLYTCRGHTAVVTGSNVGGGRITKIDAEGSEYPILYTSKYLNLCTQIVGEAHENIHIPDCPYPLGSAGIAAFLQERGFDCEVVANPRGEGSLSWFFARRRGT